MKNYSKKLFVILTVLTVVFFGIMTGHDTRTQASSNINGGSFVESFNDGVLGEEWDSLAVDGSSIYEADGVLNMNIASGPPDDGLNSSQLVDTGTKAHVLKGDFDIRINFELDPDFHTGGQTNAVLSLEVARSQKDRDSVKIGIHNYGYLSGEERQAEIPYWQTKAWTESEDLEGKLRITRQGNLITTYYWDNGWVQHAQWEPILLSPSDNLAIVMVTWNWGPDWSPFWVKWDNLISHYHRD